MAEITPHATPPTSFVSSNLRFFVGLHTADRRDGLLPLTPKRGA
jgi:hypothetical protein